MCLPAVRMTRGAGALVTLLGALAAGCNAPASERPSDAADARGESVESAAPSASPSAAPDALEGAAAGPCPEGMVPIVGKYCPYVGHRCVEWIEEHRDRCRRYAPPPLCEGRIVDKSLCMDRYEYPNQAGVLPAVMVSYIEAAEACRTEGKRLCTEDEWTFACEGEERLPYPYGWERDATACNIDRPYNLPDFEAFSHARKIAPEMERLDQRVPSGSRPRCKSPFGVFDMTGNVDEWTRNESPKPERNVDISSLKGGYFGPIRARCRPVTRSHNRWFRFYQVGFRCCADLALAEPAAPVAPGG